MTMEAAIAKDHGIRPCLSFHFAAQKMKAEQA